MHISIGFDQYSYNHRKNIYGAIIPSTNIMKVQRIPFELIPFEHMVGLPANFLKFSYFPIPWSKVDAYHCFNRIYWGNKPWGVTFEDSLPRFSCEPNHPYHKKTIQQLEADSCRFIIAMSYMAKCQFLHANSNLSADILAKLHVVHPMQPLAPKVKKLDTQGTLKILFIGNECLRKGLIPLVKAFKFLIKRTDTRLELLVVSTLKKGDYIVKIGDPGFNMIETLINHPNIKRFENLPHQEVLALIDQCHMLALPSLDDTFGYVVLEAMSRGRPVITSDIRALPEMNTEETGWHIRLPKSKERPWLWQGYEYRKKNLEQKRVALTEAYDLMEHQLIDIIEGILDKPSILTSKGQAAYERVRTDFSPEVHSQRLLEIYRSCL